MSYIKLTLTNGNPPKEKVIYVPDNWHSSMNPSVYGQDPDDFLQKLIVSLDKKHVFSKAPADGFYIPTLRHLRGNEFHLKIRNLGDLESGILRPVTTSFDRSDVKLNDELVKTVVQYDPIQHAKDNQQQAALKAEKNKIGEAEQRQAVKEKSKIMWHRLGEHARKVGPEAVKERERLKEEQERLKREQERLQAEQEERILAKIQKEHEEHMRRLKAAQAPASEVKRPVSVESQKEALQLKAPKALQKNQAISTIIQELGGLIGEVIEQEVKLKGLKPHSDLRSAQFGEGALPLNPELKKQGKAKIEKEMQAVVAIMDRQGPEIIKQIEQTQAEHEASLKAHATLDEFRKMLEGILVNYNQTHPRQKIEGSAAKMLKQRMGAIYSANPMSNPQVKLGASLQKFGEFFNVSYQQEREQLEQTKRNEKLKVFTESMAGELNAGLGKLQQAASQFKEELQQYKKTMTAYEGTIDVFNEAVGRGAADFSIMMKEVALEENKAKEIVLDDVIKKRLSPAELDAHKEARTGAGQRGLKEGYETALQNFHQRLQHTEGKWFSKLSVDPEVVASWAKVEVYRAKLANVIKQASEIEKIWPYKMVVDFCESSGEKALASVAEMAKRVSDPGLRKEVLELKKDIQEKLSSIPLDRAQMLLVPSEDAKKILDKVKQQTMAGIWEQHEAARKLEVHSSTLGRIAETQSKPMTAVQLKGLSDAELKGLDEQLRLLESIKKLLSEVPFWNKQVSGVRGPKAAYWDSKKATTVNLYVPDGVGEMLNAVMLNAKFSVPEKLEEIKKIAGARLQNKGLFGNEKPTLRRQPTQDFYKLMQKIAVKQPEALKEVLTKVETFVKDSHKAEVHKSKKGEKAPTLFKQSSKDVMPDEKTHLMVKGKPRNYGST